METIEKQKTKLLHKEEELLTCDKAGKTSEALIKNLPEKVCIEVKSVVLEKALALLLIIQRLTKLLVFRKKFCWKISYSQCFLNWTEVVGTQYCFKLHRNPLTPKLQRFRGTK